MDLNSKSPKEVQAYGLTLFTHTVIPILLLGYAVYSVVISHSLVTAFANILLAIAFRYYGTPLRSLPLWVKVVAVMSVVVFVALLLLSIQSVYV